MQLEKKGELRLNWTRVALSALFVGCLTTGYLFADSLTDVAKGASLLGTGEKFTVGLRSFTLFKDTADRRTWDEARSTCQDLGLELAPMDTVEIRDAVLAKGGSVAWIGLKRIDSVWTFTDGRDFPSTFPWPANMPRTTSDHNCATTCGTGIDNHACTVLRSFVCEDLSPSRIVSLLYADTFTVAKGGGYGYNGANAFCVRLGSHLATIDSTQEQNKVETAMKLLGVDTAWIGVSFQSGAWKGLGVDNMAAAEKTGATTASRGVVDLSGANAVWKKRDYFDSDVGGFVCEGWEYALVYKGAAIGWTEANKYCADTFGTTLSTVHDSAVNEEMTAALAAFGGSALAYIGLRDMEEGEWRWIDESPKSYLDFGPWNAAANANDDSKDCTAIAGSGHWQASVCDASAGVEGFFCAVLNKPVQCLCYDRWAVVHPLDTNKPWHAAENYCATEYGSHLASIHSTAENEEVLKCMDSCDVAQAWIGMHSTAAQKFEWTDASDATFDNWVDGVLNDDVHAKLEQSDGKWHATAGVEDMAFVCQIPIP